MKSSKLVAGAAIAVGVLFLQSPAFSQFDGQTIPGVACHRVSGGTLTRYFGTILNEHDTSALNVMCPLATQKNLTPGPEVNLYAVVAQVTDRHTTQSTQCSRFSEYMNGTSYFSDSDSVSSTGSNGSLQSLYFHETDPVYNHHYVTCSVPPRQTGNASHVISVQYVTVAE